MPSTVHLKRNEGSGVEAIDVKEPVALVVRKVNLALQKNLPHIALHDPETDKGLSIDARRVVEVVEP